MPNATVSVYLTDEEYLIYMKNKEHLNAAARDSLKEELLKLKSAGEKQT